MGRLVIGVRHRRRETLGLLHVLRLKLTGAFFRVIDRIEHVQVVALAHELLAFTPLRYLLLLLMMLLLGHEQARRGASRARARPHDLAGRDHLDAVSGTLATRGRRPVVLGQLR